MASKEIKDLDPKLQPLAKRFLELAKQAGLDVFLTCTYRSIQEQNELYAKGRTTPGPKVTSAKGGQSWHNYRLAFDVAIKKKDGSVEWNDSADTDKDKVNDWTELGKIGKSLGLTWGGEFKSFQDLPHFEYHPGLTLAAAAVKVKGGGPLL